MDQKTLKKLATQFDELAAIVIAISGTFRASSGGDEDSGADAPADKPVRAAKPAAGKGKPAAEPDEPAEASDVSEDDVREALTELLESHGKEVMVAALETVGAGKLADVDESQYQELLDAVNAAKEEPVEAAKPAAKPAAKTTKAKKGPTLEDTQAAAQALIHHDKSVYLKLAKKLGKPSEMDEGDYAAAIAAYEGAMPVDDETEGLL